MINSYPNKYRLRVDFGRIDTAFSPPKLLQNQLSSYEIFLQKNIPFDQRKNVGLEAVFRSVFPITDYSESCTLEYMYYRLGEPKYTQQECKSRGATYATPIRVLLRMIIWEQAEKTKKKKPKDIKEQEIYFGEFPLMTDTGSFIINGTERCIVSQLHKSPGVFFSHDKGKNHAVGKLLYFSSIIPQRGSWLDFEFDAKDILYVRIDRKKKFLATLLLKALGFSTRDLLSMFYPTESVDLSGAVGKAVENRVYRKKLDKQAYLNQKAAADIIDPTTGEVLVQAKRKINRVNLKKLLDSNIEYVPSDPEDIIGRYSLEEIKNAEGDVLVDCNQLVTETVLENLLEAGITEIRLLHIGHRTIGSALRDTLESDKINNSNDAVIEIYRKLKPGDVPTLDAAKTLLNNLFFNPARYDLSRVGRMKMNRKLGTEKDIDAHRVLDTDDIFRIVTYLLHLKEGTGEIDDIDHLGNRRVRGVGELLENRFRLGLVRMEKTVKERISMYELDKIVLTDIVSAKPIIAVINEFFGGSQLSQFMDQTNPLSEVTHKRRLSALGPGGLTRDRAGFEVRDVHNSHYGRICPVETPEGPNIGLISSLSTYAAINDFGFIETPYRKVNDGKITGDYEYMSAIDDSKVKISQAGVKTDKNGNIEPEFVSARIGGEFKNIHKSEIEYMDISPKQLVSVAGALIPFLEHDDANRALMGSNMQRQAVPLIKPEAPFVGTGIEHQVAIDSGYCITCKRSGIVDKVDSARIVVVADVDITKEQNLVDANVDIYTLRKYERSNQNTCISQRPLVKPGDRVEAGQVLADGASTESGELALGQNILVAFMPWNGYNYEDSIIVSQKVLKDERFTSIHIEELEVQTRETKLGKENITRDLPNVSETNLAHLDESGIIRLGSYVKTGDVLVGKTTPKGESQLNPEEKLLRAIFGDKAGDVKDTSLRVPQGMEGVVIDVKIFSRKDVEKSKRSEQIRTENLKKIETDYLDEVRIIKNNLTQKIYPLIKNAPLKYDLVDSLTHTVRVAAGEKLTEDIIMSLPHDLWREIQVEGSSDANKKLSIITKNAYFQLQCIENIFQQRVDKESRQDDLQPGVIQVVKVYVAIKRRLSVGDKMAGRHGNKGVVSKIVPIEDMPYMENGNTVDIILNPLGVPSRMNVGQVLETHLGLVAKSLGDQIDKHIAENYSEDKLKKFIRDIYRSPFVDKYLKDADREDLVDFIHRLRNGVHMSTPVFDGAKEEQIHELMDMCGIDHSGQVQLYDGQSGEPFKQKITIGYMYMLKLHHLVDDKIHARSTGPYSLITQQPLGGKAQFGGQRFGEMEVWALEAYGAAYTLRELLTVKSDDVTGRNKTYESIVKEPNPQECEAVRVSLASPENIMEWSRGEIKTSETINYRTFKPERDGLFCGKIFGPVHDYECICGKYKRMKHRGITCEKCGVEVIESKVRRERMGHIKLASPVSHVWFLKGLPSRLANVLDMTLKDVEKVLYFDAYVVLEPAGTEAQVREVIDELRCQELKAQDEDFVAMMGAEAIKELILRINIEEESHTLREELKTVNSETKRKKIIKRLKIIESFKDSGIDPGHMILEVIPVISPDLRPLVSLDGGRFATSDLNDLYRRVIHRNNRLKRLIELNAPEIIVKNEKRMLQEAVDALFDNGRRGKPILGTNKRPLKSLSDSLKGKYGRFRQNLLGKRVDYSARTVIVWVRNSNSISAV
ncbi:hypothetical protein CHS0354_018547 [Potamilus streckersoni]|uniref:DNA-directed RNA polymerase subunit n=1 Tax=Potamilus streckersoni TaxID=2493646 RepID=A0AAE0TAT9_9BIVA|nr:hypothetical protein CHS0354_018547 [Potamilus streckersoni]